MQNWNTIPTKSAIAATIDNLKSRGINVELLANKSEVLTALKKLIPEKSRVMTGSSTTLNQAGVTDYLSSAKSNWHNVQNDIWSEDDEQKRSDLRRELLASEYFLASANAIAQTGQIVAVDATGSRVSAYPFAAKQLILVVGVNKITPTLDDAMTRIREHVFPLEDKRAQEAYGMGSTFGKWVIIEREVNPTRIHVLLVNEILGF